MKKKIAILTLPLGHNYGGIIQNYALQKTLKNLGSDVVTINRNYNNSHSNFRILLGKYKGQFLSNFLSKNIFPHWKNKILYKSTFEFIRKNIYLSEEIDSNEKMFRFTQKHQFDAYVVGSDQTWRPQYSPNIYEYYLNFLDSKKETKKIAYASSFGTAEWEYTKEQTQKCKALIQQFTAVSVREDSGVDLCENYLEVSALHVLDPTLLLNADDYSLLINKAKENKEKTLFTYVLDNANEIQNVIEDISKTLNLKHTSNQASTFNISKKRKTEDYIMPPLESWLQGFRDSEFVITDSFHGTVFSIINQKPFISLVNSARGAARFESLLSKLGLENRLVYDIDHFDQDLLIKEIDYIKVFEKLENLKKESLEFLKFNLKL